MRPPAWRHTLHCDHSGDACTSCTDPRCTKLTLANLLSCAGVVDHNDKVQRVSTEEAITGLHTSSPVSRAFCLSADAVKPSLLSLSLSLALFSLRLLSICSDGFHWIPLSDSLYLIHCCSPSISHVVRPSRIVHCGCLFVWE